MLEPMQLDMTRLDPPTHHRKNRAMGRKPNESRNAKDPRKAGRSGGARAHSFLLRIWPQFNDDTSGRNLWRGYVADLSGANTRHFEDGDTLARILYEAVGAQFPGLGRTRNRKD